MNLLGKRRCGLHEAGGRGAWPDGQVQSHSSNIESTSFSHAATCADGYRHRASPTGHVEQLGQGACIRAHEYFVGASNKSPSAAWIQQSAPTLQEAGLPVNGGSTTHQDLVALSISDRVRAKSGDFGSLFCGHGRRTLLRIDADSSAARGIVRGEVSQRSDTGVVVCESHSCVSKRVCLGVFWDVTR